MTTDDILARLDEPGVSAERLLEECRRPDPNLWSGNARLYRAFTEKLLVQGFPARALELAHEGDDCLRDDIELQYLLALAARRGGNARYAQTLLQPLLPHATYPATKLPLKLRVNVLALQGAVLKLLARRSPHLVTESAAWYERAANLHGVLETPDAGTFPLINAATMWRLAGDLERSRTLAAEVIRRLDTTDERSADPVWGPATRGETYLLLGDHEKAGHWYQRAVAAALADNRLGHLASVRTNIELLRSAGVTADPAFMDEHLGSVVVFSGHMVDSPERLKAGHPTRFPNSPALIDGVRKAITNKLTELNVKIGFCSLACGGDLLFARAMLDRNAELHIVLPFAQTDFLLTSVTFGQTGDAWLWWKELFDEILEAVPAHRVRYTTTEPYLGSVDLFGLSNRVQQGLAVMRARERGTIPQAVVLLDESLPGQAGGTGEFAAVWQANGYVAHKIDLAELRNQAGPWADPQDPPAIPPNTSKLNRPVRSMLFADVAGFSRIPEWKLDDFLEAYGSYLRTLFASEVGRRTTYANTWGDGIYAVFDTVVDAANFALELVEPAIGRQPEWMKYDLGDTIPFRVGLHTGPVFELPDLFQGRAGYGGQHVNRSARIEPATVRGCAYCSEPFAALLTLEGGPAYHIESVGLHSLAKEYDRCPLYRVARGTPNHAES